MLSPQSCQTDKGEAAAVAEAVYQQLRRALVIFACGGQGLEEVDSGVEVLKGVRSKAEGASYEEKAGGGIKGEMLIDVLEM